MMALDNDIKEFADKLSIKFTSTTLNPQSQNKFNT